MALQTQKKPLPPQHRVILDHLCKSPAQIYDFTEIAEATKTKRAVVELVFRDLRHQRFGAILSDIDNLGFPLRPRFAYLPATSKAREGYPAVADITVENAEHPALAASRRQFDDEKARVAREAGERAAAGRVNGVAAANYKKAKNEARDKAAMSAAPRSKSTIREMTGQIYVPEGAGPLGPSMPAEFAPVKSLGDVVAKTGRDIALGLAAQNAGLLSVELPAADKPKFTKAKR